MLAGDLVDLGKGFSSLPRQMQCVLAAIAFLRLALHHAAILQLVKNRHQSTRVDAKFFRQLLLADALSNRQQTKDPSVWRGKTQSGNAFPKLRGGMRPNLSQQKSRTEEPLRRNIHKIILQPIIAYCNHLVYK